MVVAFLVLAIGMCYGKKNKNLKRIWWCALCGIAATQHIVAVAYIPFVFVWNNKKALKYIVIGSSIVIAILLVSPGSMVNLISSIVSLVADEARSEQYGVRSTKLGIIVMVAESVAMMVIARLSALFVGEYNELQKNKGCVRLIETTHFDFVVNLLYYSSIFWPFYFLNGNFTRLMQNEFMIVYMTMATILKCALAVNWRMKRRARMSNALIGSIVLFIPLYIYNLISIWGGLYQEVVTPILLDLF